MCSQVAGLRARRVEIAAARREVLLQRIDLRLGGAQGGSLAFDYGDHGSGIALELGNQRFGRRRRNFFHRSSGICCDRHSRFVSSRRLGVACGDRAEFVSHSLKLALKPGALHAGEFHVSFE